MDNDVSKKIIARIREDHITPDPKWKVSLTDYVFWVILTVVLLLAGVCLSLVVYNFSIFNKELLGQFALKRTLALLFVSAPYFWMVLFVLSFVLGYYILRKTKKGYRYSVALVGAVILVATAALGALAHYGQINASLERAFVERTPGLRTIAPPRRMRLVAPKSGLLGGIIITIEPETIWLRSFKQEDWQVNYDQQTEIRGPRQLDEGIEVLVIGQEIGELLFDADTIRPLPPRTMEHRSSEDEKPRRMMKQGQDSHE